MKKSILIPLLLISLTSLGQQAKPYLSIGPSYTQGYFRNALEFGAHFDTDDKFALLIMDGHPERRGDTLTIYIGLRGYKYVTSFGKFKLDAILGGYLSAYDNLQLQTEAGASLRYLVSPKVSLQINESVHTKDYTIGAANWTALMISYLF